MRTSVPVLWSFNGGYVDTAGFLAIQGIALLALFAARTPQAHTS
jgi:uncharacterized membrane protein YoaK (UPF0700 family)